MPSSGRRKSRHKRRGNAKGKRHTMKKTSTQGKSSGRPRKFEGPSRVVTLTLPEDTIARLQRIDEDRAKAIVMATEIAAPPGGASEAMVDLVQVAPNLGMLTVSCHDCLKSIPGLRLVRAAPNQWLIVLPSGTPLSDIEIALADQLETRGEHSAGDHQVMAQLLQHIRSYRRSKRVEKAEVLLVEM
jgi:hypothetical protein